jgi:DNA-binding response OmpR family regulator
MSRILLVEDDRAILRGLEENLQYEGHAVRCLMRGDLALQEVAADPPDLLILDVMLPGQSGFEICRQLRRTNRQLPILMLTARAEDVDKVMGLDLGADDYLTKPFSLTELLARVRALLRRSAGQAASVLPDHVEFGGVSVDFVRYVAMRNGASVHLTAKEFALLRHLVAADGAAIRRDTLLERVWGEGVSVTNRTVDTHVLALRQKFEADPEAPRHLLTVHGVGYRFVAAP